MSTLETISSSDLQTISGGIDPQRIFDRGLDEAGRWGTVGTLGGAAAGSLVPGVGTAAGAGAGGLIGTGVGFVSGAGRELVDQIRGQPVGGIVRGGLAAGLAAGLRAPGR